MVAYGLEIFSSEAHAPRYRAFYFRNYDTDDFVVRVVFGTHGEYERFARWLQGYGEARGSPDATVGPVKVTIPVRDFAMSGIPIGAVPYGVRVDDRALRMTVPFEGAGNLLAPTSPKVSQFYLPELDKVVAPQFYPAGNQVGGIEEGYDASPESNDVDPIAAAVSDITGTVRDIGTDVLNTFRGE